MIRIDVSNQHPRTSAPVEPLQAAVTAVLTAERITSAEISVAVVDDPTIHELNRRHLQHDYPTDVLSFPLDSRDGHIEGEIVVSADMAAIAASRFGWRREDELVLYVVHGTLHLVGYDDHSEEDRRAMRGREREVLRQFGLAPKYDDSDFSNAVGRAATGEDDQP